MKILVPVDASELSRSAVPLAIELAGAWGRGLLFVTVADTATRTALAGLAEAEHDDPIDIIEAGLRFLAGSAAGVEADYELIPGEDPAMAIVERADRPDVGMIVLATHGRTGVSRWRLGSVAEKVVRAATVPVTVVPAPRRAREPAGEEARLGIEV
jgi:nucleotide-binding universal stress UspA family protein